MSTKLSHQRALEVLEISSSATEDEIKQAYKRLALKTHPDKNPNDPTANERFHEVSAAYTRLSETKSYHGHSHSRYGHSGFGGDYYDDDYDENYEDDDDDMYYDSDEEYSFDDEEEFAFYMFERMFGSSAGMGFSFRGFPCANDHRSTKRHHHGGRSGKSGCAGYRPNAEASDQWVPEGDVKAKQTGKAKKGKTAGDKKKKKKQQDPPQSKATPPRPSSHASTSSEGHCRPGKMKAPSSKSKKPIEPENHACTASEEASGDEDMTEEELADLMSNLGSLSGTPAPANNYSSKQWAKDLAGTGATHSNKKSTGAIHKFSTKQAQGQNIPETQGFRLPRKKGNLSSISIDSSKLHHKYQTEIDVLKGMGFSHHHVLVAIEQSYGNVEMAAAMLSGKDTPPEENQSHPKCDRGTETEPPVKSKSSKMKTSSSQPKPIERPMSGMKSSNASLLHDPSSPVGVSPVKAQYQRKTKICEFYRTPRGCTFGDACRFLHHSSGNSCTDRESSSKRVESKKKLCAFFFTPKGCRFGDECKFVHAKNK